MAQPQSQVPARAYSPPQPTPSPAGSQSGYALPPNKRVGASSQPGSPYMATSYAASPGAAGSPPTAGSPTYAQTPPVQGGYNTPYANGTPVYNVAEARAAAAAAAAANANATISPMQQHQQIPAMMTPYTNATLMPAMQQGQQQMQQNVMGPPQRPAERPAKDYEYDVTDSLAGTGIDLRAEEQYMSELYSNAMDGNQDARTGFAVYPPTGANSFYGAGPASQPAEMIKDQSQKDYEAHVAERAWKESAMRLAAQRTQEIADPFLFVAIMHRRADKIAREHHLGLNLELRGNTYAPGKLRHPDQFPTPSVNVKTQPGPDSTMVSTTGSFIPHDAYLVDQFALLSISTKQRLRELLEDANAIALNRQKTSHGDIPEEWAAAAAPMNKEVLEVVEAPNAEGRSEVGDGSLKRTWDQANGEVNTKPAKLPKISSYMTVTMRELAKREREWEEARLRRRQKRKDGTLETTTAGPKSGSAAPGTPGTVAPESDKAMTKKEQKKNQAMKAAEANSHANQNLTSSMFAGLGGKSGLFGKSKRKTYDWMNVGRGGSGASTPVKSSSDGGKVVNGMGPSTPTNLALTTEGRNRLGTWREDKEKGRNIQLRDWIAVLERDGREAQMLQHAYLQLDSSNPR
ncbi:hypothetical protein BB8028_0007g02800 [Beauveria bassiana]|uniref:Transcription initiation factor TFIID subunit 4 n=2 Tax=Beauveria bassiana TaxID=176275 RepID=A0A0A2W242_BEABA|nr:hypothetical protein CRV24_006452 [Beauveria bassiana]KAH8713415.1 hypothetical protein HC256_006575 [Beauveria bassiana]KGQ07054.1 hypothetical protein BBAD15_g7579 [Beauveria bassiana D1-5]PQK17081.1 hypothetical protein BB8028_0007g02800 [Beauveria bassiana]